jgi:hypothetical protein
MESSLMPSWDTIREFINELGALKGVFVLFFFIAHGWIYGLYHGRIKDRQKEIDRLAKDNHEYRDRFMKLLDKKFGN